MAASVATASTDVEAKQAGDLLVRARAIVVAPDESGTTPQIGGNVSIDNAVVPELDFTYFITDNIGVELILATAKHHPDVNGTTLGDVDLGGIWLLPPTLTLQYHFNPQGQISPYVGAGINYTIFYSADLPTGGVATDISYDDGFGFALQAGVDYQIDEKWSLNVDVKKLWLGTDVSVNSGGVTSDVDIDPWIFGVGFGYTF
ncbi:MAG: hypothetical protein CMF31_08930 [Kordiimonas sp.]|nr:hypothetical protein [Kordiimonas sp.]